MQIGIVRVDPDTGEATVERFLLAYDIGRSINPMLVEGQLVGGFVQGLGGALYEEFRYDERGQPLSATLADYPLPTACETPAVEVLVNEDAPRPLNPLGLKSVGEGARVLAGILRRERAASVRAAGADAVIDLSAADLRESLRAQMHAVTEGRGADIILDPLVGEIFESAMRALAWRGRLVVIGFAAGAIRRTTCY